MLKMPWVLAWILTLAGIFFVIVGSFNSIYWSVRLAGIFICLMGLVGVGNRLYEKIKEKARLVKKRKARYNMREPITNIYEEWEE